MRVKYKKTIQILLFSQLALGLSACGSGSNVVKSLVEDVVEEEVTDAVLDAVDDSVTNDGMDAGSGGCVTFPRPKVGQKVTRELKDSDGEISLLKSTEIMAVSNTSITQNITGSSFGITFDTTNIEEYTIANNFRDYYERNCFTKSLGFKFRQRNDFYTVSTCS